MIGQIISLGGGWGTAARAIDGTVQLAVALWLFWSLRHSYPRLRAWRAAVAAAWLALALALLASPLGLMPSEWTPWIVHGVLVVLGPVVALAYRSSNRVAKKSESELISAMEHDR